MTKPIVFSKTKYWVCALAEYAAFLLSSGLLYALNPQKGLSWALIFLIQIVASFTVFYGTLGREENGSYSGEDSFRKIAFLQLPYQLVLLAVWCLIGFLSHLIFKEKSGWITFAGTMAVTGVAHMFYPTLCVAKEIKSKIGKWLYAHDLYLHAFFVTITVYLVLYSIYEVYPFGENIYLRMDCYHQYAPFLKEFYRHIHEGDGLFFAWENGLGVNYWAHYGYYLSSPSNWLLLLLPKSHILEGITAGIMIKGGLASVSFLYYLQRKNRGRDMIRLLLALFYGGSAYYLAYSCNIMWSDSYILIPLIFLGVEKIAEGKNSFLYGLSLCLCIFSNFYIAIIVGLAVVIYFLANLILHAREGKVILKIGRFVFTTIVVCMITAVILLPEYLCLKNTVAGDFAFPEKWESYFPFHELFTRMLLNVDTVQKDSNLPNIFASLFAFFLLPYFFFNKKIKPLKKVLWGIMIVFLLFSFQWNTLTYIWHGLHFPNSFPARHSFFYVFLILSMADECYEKKDGVHKVFYIPVSVLVTAGCIVLWVLFSANDILNGVTTYLFSALLILCYGALFFLRKKIGMQAFQIVLFSLLFVEFFSNTLAVGVNSTVDRTEYVEDEKLTESVLAQIRERDEGFYRIEEADKRFMNEAGWDGYYGASVFSSTISGGVVNFYSQTGMRYSEVAYAHVGATPYTSSLLGVRYILAKDKQYLGDTFREEILVGEDEEDGYYYVYENLYPLSVGYGISREAFDSFPEEKVKAPFANSQEIARTILPDVNIYRVLPVYGFSDSEEHELEGGKTITGKATTYYVPAGQHAFFYVVNYLDGIQIINQNMDGEIINSYKETGLKFRHIMDLGEYDEDRMIKMISVDNGEDELHFQAYCLNEAEYLRLMAEMSKDSFEVKEYSSTKMIGTFSCEEDEMLVFSIPYDDGFSITIDGVKVKTEKYANAFLAVPVSAGNHNVVIRYAPPGFYKGLCITAVGILLAALWIMLSRLQMKKAEAKSVKEEEEELAGE
ncbi:MAG: YfhO family protein [Lachnospiraceae bacterium]|nr:YfhO family protein [Lachnospiraceae bacterium]